MKSTALRKLPLVASLAVALAVGACGSEGEEKVTVAPSEGVYVDIGEVAYQVQISRILNPRGEEDRSYLVGLPAGETKEGLGPDEQWFAVFLRAQSYGDKPEKLATSFRVIDTEGSAWKPIELSDVNQYRWAPEGDLPAGYTYPGPNSMSGAGPVRDGSLLLFKVRDSIYQNRPLVLEIHDPENPKKVAATVNLDL